jgi:hypothetical protein
LDSTVSTNLRGEPVTISSIDVTGVGRGEFTLDNDGDEAVSARVSEAWLELGDERRSLSDFSIYDLDGEQPVEGGEMSVSGGGSMRFLLGFPRVAVSGGPVAVGARVVAGDDELEAVSQVRLERRMPPDSDDNIA